MITYTTQDPPVVRADGALTLVGPTEDVCTGCAENARLAQAPKQTLTLKGITAPAFAPLVAALENHQSGTVTAIRSDLGLVSTHRIKPGTCCEPVQNSAENTKTPNGELRTPNGKTTAEALKEALVDFRHGPVTALFRTGHLPLATVTAELDAHTVGYGRTTSFEEAERTAIFELIERLNGMRPRKPAAVDASFAELGPTRAVDPATLGLDDENDTYHPNLKMRWVEGWSYTRSRKVLVPEQIAYWGVPGERFVHETSNGCGLGNSLTEAVLHGLFEVAERDAFLMAWYGKTPLRRIKATDPLLHHLEDRLEELGYELLFLDATNDLKIPAVMTLARAKRPGLPQAFFAAGASPDPVKAMRSAAVEVAVDVEAFADRARAKPEDYASERLKALLENPKLVRSMDDHVAVNTLEEAKERYSFLVNDEPPQHLHNRRTHTDLKHLLAHHVEAMGLEVIAVDQSDPHTVNTLGLHAAKVVVPGALPMTFGHRRTKGLARLVPRQTHPHPFP
ncbi:YcaO-like family protein [Lentzea sp. JNUCC 0626]|uniref:YcaO-like family protein n=1 Tax=Lentzea sp. JNUCC 0626 TaxID=3367513 RepID=UPI003747CBD2